MQVDGKRYKKCIAWSQVAGKGAYCPDMCSEEQREKCYEQQMKDRNSECRTT